MVFAETRHEFERPFRMPILRLARSARKNYTLIQQRLARLAIARLLSRRREILCQTRSKLIRWLQWKLLL